MRDVVGLFGANFSLTLEDYFTQLEFLAEAIKLSPPGGGGLTASDLRDNRERLLAAVSLVLEVSTDAAIRTAGGCEHHERMVQHLRAKDTIISFNYDCVVDHALRRFATGCGQPSTAMPFRSRIASLVTGSGTRSPRRRHRPRPHTCSSFTGRSTGSFRLRLIRTVRSS